MRHMRFLALALLSTSSVFLSSASAQSTSLGLAARLTASDGAFSDNLGSSVAISGGTAVALKSGVQGIGAYVFEKPPSGWAAATQTAKLTPSNGDGTFGTSVAISGDTVFVGAYGTVYVFVKPSAGWQNMHETAQLNDTNGARDGFGQAVAVDGNTVAVTADTQGAVYLFGEPTAGWSTTSTYLAKLTAPNGTGLYSVALNGDTVVLGYSELACVFEKPSEGWASTSQPTANLTRANGNPQDEFGFGFSVAIFGDRIAVGAYYVLPGVVDLFVEPAYGWTDATQTVELTPPTTANPPLYFGRTVAMDSAHLIVGSEDEIFVYSQPPTGWAASVWPSQQLVGNPGSFFGDNVYGSGVAIDGETVVAGAPLENINGVKEEGAAYLFTLFPNPIEVSTDYVAYPDMTFGASEVELLTVTNLGSAKLTFTTTMDSPNYQVLQTAENTCSASVLGGQSCVLPIQFDPPGVGVHTNHLTLNSPSTASLRIIELSGLAGGVGAANEGLLNFGTVNDGTTSILPLVVTNFGVPGSPTVAVSSSNPYFSLASQGTCAAGVAEGKTCTLMIKFAPVDPGGFFSPQITLTPSTGAASKVEVQGYGYDTSLTP